VIHKTLFSLLIVMCCLSSGVSADSDQPSNWQVLLQLDNDLFAGSDRDYTSGARIGVIREVPLDSELGQRINRRLQKRSKKLGEYRLQSFRIGDQVESFATGYALTQLMFTPEDFTTLTAPEGERPYAGWLGLEISWHVKAIDFVNSFTWSIGTTGDSSLAQKSQNWVHQNISGSPIFQGWDSQVPSELTLNVHFDHKQRLRKLSKNKLFGLEVDGYYEYGFSAGNFQSNAYVGSLARIGYRLPSSFTTPRVQLGSYAHELFSSSKTNEEPFSAFAYAGFRATGVLHDISLDGPVFRGFDTSVESKPLVGEALYGFGARYRNVELVFSQTIRSDEFVNQTENQRFGSLMLRFQSGF